MTKGEGVVELEEDEGGSWAGGSEAEVPGLKAEERREEGRRNREGRGRGRTRKKGWMNTT